MLLFLMMLTPEQKEHAIELIQMGDKEAVRYLQQVLNVNAEQALLLTKKLEEEIMAEDEAVFEELKVARENNSQQPPVNAGRIASGIFMGVGSVILAVAAWIGVSNYKFAQQALRVKGTVIMYSNYESRNDYGSQSTMYTPTYQYVFNGKTYTYTSSTSSSSHEYEINENVNVLVDPQKPEEVLIDSFWERWFVMTLLGGMGTLITGVSYIVYRIMGNADSSK
jgi:Protein of unknown function (DUF3592)